MDSEAPNHNAWNPWHPIALSHRLAGTSMPWCVVGGWALDLWHGYQTRDHEDLEFTILSGNLAAVRQLFEGVAFYTVADGIIRHLPAGKDPPPDIAQIWCLDVREQCWRADMMIERGTPETWVCKRDPAIVRPRAEVVATTSDGIPYLKPAAVLLFKAKHRRDKDDFDFEIALPKLDARERLWLRICLETIHPGHGWVRAL